MNLVAIPFHDWRKVQREGARTRDAHLINELVRRGEVDALVVVNRPMSVAEMIYRRCSWRTRGRTIETKLRSQLVEVSPRLYVIDLMSRDPIGPAVRGKDWFFDAYSSQETLETIEYYLDRLCMKHVRAVSFNVYAAGLFAKLNGVSGHFDAWDNFLRFPANHAIMTKLAESYRVYADTAASWTTNSDENAAYFLQTFGITACPVIRNGVDPGLIEVMRACPRELTEMTRPIAGMGLKVTHLLDTDILNTTIEANSGVSFVLLGQVLDRKRFASISRRSNFRYLGDKPYAQYLAFLQHFDVCLMPYHLREGQHGGDSIKFYEYLAAGKPVVATPGNGASGGFPGVWLAESPEDFARAVREASKSGPFEREIPSELTWAHKSAQLIDTLTCERQKEIPCAAPVM